MTAFQKIHSARHARVKEPKVQWAAPKDCAVSLDDWLALTHHPDAPVRARAIGDACPCHMKKNVPELWDRLIEMVADEDAKVRSHVFHILGDGSPRAREAEIVAALERLWNDPDEKLRRRVRKLLASYRRNGWINQL